MSYHPPSTRTVRPVRIRSAGIPRVVKEENNTEMATRALPASALRSSRQVTDREKMELKRLTRKATPPPARKKKSVPIAMFLVGANQEKHKWSEGSVTKLGSSRSRSRSGRQTQRVSIAKIDVDDFYFNIPKHSRLSSRRPSSVAISEKYENQRHSSASARIESMQITGETKLIHKSEAIEKEGGETASQRRRMSCGVSFNENRSQSVTTRRKSTIGVEAGSKKGKRARSLNAVPNESEPIKFTYNVKKGDPAVKSALIEISEIQIRILLGLIIRIQRFVRRVRMRRSFALFRDSIRIIQRQYRAYRCRSKYLDILKAKQLKKSSMKVKQREHAEVDEKSAISGNGDYTATNSRDSDSLNFCRARSRRIMTIRFGFFEVESGTTRDWDSFGEILDSGDYIYDDEPFDRMSELYEEKLASVPKIHAERGKGDSKLAMLRSNVDFFLPMYSLKSLISTKSQLDNFNFYL